MRYLAIVFLLLTACGTVDDAARCQMLEEASCAWASAEGRDGYCDGEHAAQITRFGCDQGEPFSMIGLQCDSCSAKIEECVAAIEAAMPADSSGSCDPYPVGECWGACSFTESTR